jgi:hypothetical protein
VCTSGKRGACVLVFKVKPVVAVLQVENMSFDLVIVVGSAETRRVEIKIDQPTLDRKQAAKKCSSILVFEN